MTTHRKALLFILLALTLITTAPMAAQNPSVNGATASLHRVDPKLLLVQQDKVVAFDTATGIGAQTGTATGAITGVSIVNFRFQITSFPAFSFESRVGITDLDGDQIIFRNVGTGRFIIPGLADPTLPPATPPYQVFANGLGGPLTGTYEVVATSGKFTTQFQIGEVFLYRAAAYNPSTPPTAPGTLGAVYTEVSRP